jgi:hypothetical protein
MGLLNEIISLNSIHGRRIPDGIQVFSACNPYRERKNIGEEAGMVYTDTTPGVQLDEMRNLVYRVKPIPDGTLSYVFDYGALKAAVEKTYVKSMVKRLLGDGIEATFDGFGVKKKGFITKEDYERVWTARYTTSGGELVPKQKIAVQWDKIDTKRTGQVTRKEFVDVMQGRNERRINQYAELIWKASEFIRLHEGDASHHGWVDPKNGADCNPKYAETSATSLRDVARCLKLLVWFSRTRGPDEGEKMNRPVFPPQDWFDENNIPDERTKKPFIDPDGIDTTTKDEHRLPLLSRAFEQEIDPLTPRAMVLSLALVYFFRLSNRADREEFRRRLEQAGGMEEFDAHFTIHRQKNIVDGEMKMYSENMDLSGGGLKDIAMNEALKENVFVMIVCILNRIPTFIVGKPGSSKSLAIQIVVNNVCIVVCFCA